MITGFREKVLRVPSHMISFAPVTDEFGFYIEEKMSELFGMGEVGKFQYSPTYKPFIDYVLEYESGVCGEYGKTRALTESEKEKYLPVFQKIAPDINMDYVRLVEFCWCYSCKAPDYYEEEEK